MHSHERYEHQILTAIGSGQPLSQRALATRVGIALGLANLLVRGLVRKGWVRITRARPNHIRYVLTVKGVAEQARLSHVYLQDAIGSYQTARTRIREGLAAAGGPSTRIVFYGTGEIAEIAYVCLQETDLELVGVICDRPDARSRRFFGLPVHSPDQVHDSTLAGVPFDRLIVTSFETSELAGTRLRALGVAPERVHWL